MTITINGNRRTFARNMTLLEFLKENHLNQDAVVVEINRDIVQKKDFAYVSLKENDVVEIISFVGGG